MALPPIPGWFEAALHGVALALEALAAITIAAGAVLAVANVLKKRRSEEARRILMVSLLFALDFTIGADILKIALAPDWRTVAAIGGVVLIRLAMTAALAWELREARKASPPRETPP